MWTWCYILRPILEPIYGAALQFPPNPPDPAYFAAVNRITPELQKLLLPAIDRAFVDVRRELTPQIEAIVRGSFGKAAAG